MDCYGSENIELRTLNARFPSAARRGALLRALVILPSSAKPEQFCWEWGAHASSRAAAGVSPPASRCRSIHQIVTMSAATHRQARRLAVHARRRALPIFNCIDT